MRTVLLSLLLFLSVPQSARAWQEVQHYFGIICHERDAAEHIAGRLVTAGVDAAERTFHLIRALKRDRESRSLASHLKPKPYEACECAASKTVSAPKVIVHGSGDLGTVTKLDEALPHPLYTQWAYVRTVYHISGTQSICEPLTQ